MRLYDTARREVVDFAPGQRVTMYTCGITPYDSAHLGHAAVYFTYDLLQRRLRDAGHETRCVRNVTDVDDDILRKARELGVHYQELAASEVARFQADMTGLGLLAPFSEPRATGAIPDILGFIGMVLESGHAYRSGGAVYFAASSYPGFGSLSGLSRDEMLALAAERGGRPEDPAKRDPLDFVLWQPSLEDEPAWDSLWGPGRPGWHIECSALALRELGETIDLHGGGNDLVFPHHECERAQSESVTGRTFVRHWTHVGMVGLKGVKMSKSLGNLVFVGELLERHGTDAVRLALAAQHYRSAWDYEDALLSQAEERLERWRSSSGRRGGGEALLGAVRARLDDDLDAPGALDLVDEAADAGGDLAAAMALLGIGERRGAGGASSTVAARRYRPTMTADIADADATDPQLGPITVTLPDGSTRTMPAGSTAADLAAAIGSRLGRDAIAAEIDGTPVDLAARLKDGASVRIVTPGTPAGREVLRHSSAHVMAQAVLDLWPGARFAIGPAIADGFYYDFELPAGARFREEDLERVEARMRQIIAEDQPFVREEVGLAEALERFADQPFKTEIIKGVANAGAAADAELLAETGVSAGEGGTAGGAPVFSIYTNPGTVRVGGPFVDLCRGPHVPSTGRLGHFKLTRVAGAYWRGDEHREQLQRIYGAAFESAEALAEHLHRLEEAERRDHRKLGVELDLFSFPEEIGSGLVVFHPKGGLVRKVMEDYARRRHEEAGYQFVNTPHITKAGLFETSGHLEWYAEGMFPPMELDGGQRYYLKPMNCPFHILVYKARQRSYRELPMRLFEFGSVYRYEKSGVVHGLTRVRGMTQDDAHIFCTTAQMREEITSLLSFVLDLLRDYGLEDFYLELSTRPEGKVVGSEEEWEQATATLRAAGEAMGLELVLDPGGGAFYAPKISVQARDAIGRTWQLSTIQVDLQLPQRFGLEYVSAENTRERPVMIHRALFGSVERFFGVLLEHYAGAFPTWLAPVQAAVLPVRDDHAAYAGEVRDALAAAGVRVEVLGAGEPLGTRVRRAKHSDRVPYVLVVGEQDVAARTVGVNARSGEGEERGVPLDEVVARLSTESRAPARTGTAVGGGASG